MSGFDYSSSFAGINGALANLGKQNELAWQRERFSEIGNDINAGDLKGASSKLVALGDIGNAASLLKLGQTQKQNDLVSSTLQSWNGQPQGLATIGQPQQGYFATTANAESSNNPTAKNPNSTATGVFQFTDGTWADVAKANPQLGLTPDGRTDPVQQQKAMQAFTGQNAKILQTQGIPPNDANLYMTHFLGAQGGPAFLKGMQANPNAPAIALVSPQAAAANKGVFYNPDGTPRTAGEVYQRMTARYGSGSTAVASLQGGEQPQQPGQSAAPIQVAEAAPQGGAPLADVRPGDGAPAEFVIPGTNTLVSSVPSIANDKNVQLWSQRLSSPAAAQNDKVRAIAQKQLDIAIKDAELRYNSGKAPESVREWQWARQNGMTTAKSPTAYAAELAAAKRDPDTDVTNLRKEVQQLPSYKNISQAAPIYRSMAETAGRNTKASDLNLVYGLGKIMDPTSVVREGEMIMVKNSAGMSEQLMGAINALNGGAALTPETRQALMQEAYSRMNTYRQQFDQDMGQYRGIVGRRGFNADDVIPTIGEFKPYEAPPKPSGEVQPAPTAQAQPLPQDYVDQYRRPDGSSPPLPSQSAPTQPATPKPGELLDGYRFKGGKADDPKNWVKVK